MSHIKRLKGKNSIQQVYQEGFQSFAYPFKMIWLKRAECDVNNALYISIWVGKRNIRLAVDRNKIKRRTRAAVQNHNNLLAEKLLYPCDVILIYTAKKIMDYKLIDKSIYTLINKIIRRSV